jgi:DNA-directed RNA polymerase I, II, and III subunit RPABC2
MDEDEDYFDGGYQSEDDWEEEDEDKEDDEDKDDEELLEEQQRAQERMIEEGFDQPQPAQINTKELFGKDRRGRKFLSKYERARLLGARAIQISNNAPITVDIGTGPNTIINPVKIAEMELEQRTMPLKVRRFNPDGTFEDWSLDELQFLRFY